MRCESITGSHPDRSTAKKRINRIMMQLKTGSCQLFLPNMAKIPAGTRLRHRQSILAYPVKISEYYFQRNCWPRFLSNSNTKAGHARNPRNKETLTARSKTRSRRQGRKGTQEDFFSFAGCTANEKAALSKTVSRFWTIHLLRVFNFAYLASLRFKLSCFLWQGFKSNSLIASRMWIV